MATRWRAWPSSAVVVAVLVAFLVESRQAAPEASPGIPQLDEMTARRLASAEARVAVAAEAFNELRVYLRRLRAEELAQFRRALSSADKSDLVGASDEARSLQGRFHTLQRRAQDLLAILSSNISAPLEAVASALVVPLNSTGDIIEHALATDTAANLSQEVEANVSDSAQDTLAAGCREGCEEPCLGDCLSNGTEVLQAMVPDFEALADDLEVHLAHLRQLLASAPLLRGPESVPSGAATGRKADPPGRGSEQRSLLLEQVVELSDLARKLGNSELLGVARRLGARAAAAAGEAEVRRLAREVEEAAARARRALVGEEASSSIGPAAAPGHAGGSAAGECTQATIEAAGQRFDSILAGFHGRILKEVMLPPETENLQRVVHSLEARKHALLHQLKTGLVGSPEAEEECNRYYAGVQQLQADLEHFEQLAQASPVSGKTQPAKPAAGGLLAKPRLPEAAWPPLVRPGSSRSAPALDARTFG